jgi:hypothetical protein
MNIKGRAIRALFRTINSGVIVQGIKTGEYDFKTYPGYSFINSGLRSFLLYEKKMVGTF